jgi:hypothetical protein
MQFLSSGFNTTTHLGFGNWTFRLCPN